MVWVGILVGKVALHISGASGVAAVLNKWMNDSMTEWRNEWRNEGINEWMN